MRPARPWYVRLGAIAAFSLAVTVVVDHTELVHADTSVGPMICDPEPPDYPGCTVEQTRPQRAAEFKAMFTGHATGYRWYVMHQQHRGVIWAGVTEHHPALMRHLAGLYADLVGRTKAHQDDVIYGNWYGYSKNSTSFCDRKRTGVSFPAYWCGSSVDGQSANSARIRSWLWGATKMSFSCNSTILSLASGTIGAKALFKMGLGTLKGGFYTAVGTEITCQTAKLFTWADG